MDYKTAIIGPKDVISGFKALGVVPFNAEDGEQALEVIKNIKKEITGGGDVAEKFAVVIVIESTANQIPANEFEKVSRGALPAIVVLPGLEGSTGAGVAKLKSLAERAVGSDILD
jgi:V/A-type H+-transporting ATPase subunit F